MAYSSRTPADPLTGPLKSALQKAIRRGEVDWAATYAYELGQRDMEQVARRITVIVPEDVEWRAMDTVVRASREELGRRPHDPAQPSLLDLAAGLASMPKQREASYLLWAHLGQRRARPTFAAVEAAIDAGDYAGLLGLVEVALDEKSLFGKEGIGNLMVARAVTPGIVKAGLFRARFGGVGVWESLAAAVLAVFDDVTDEEQVIPWSAWQRHDELAFPWYVFDGHTGIGSAALGHTARKMGVPKDVLRALMFGFSSVVSGPSMRDGRWHREAEAAEAVKYKYGTPEEGAHLWARYEGEIRGFIEWLMSKEGIKSRD